MKIIYSILLIFAFLSTTACGGNNEPQVDDRRNHYDSRAHCNGNTPENWPCTWNSGDGHSGGCDSGGCGGSTSSTSSSSSSSASSSSSNSSSSSSGLASSTNLSPAHCLLDSLFGCSETTHYSYAGAPASGGRAQSSEFSRVHAAIDSGAERSSSKEVLDPSGANNSVEFKADSHFTGGYAVSREQRGAFIDGHELTKTARSGSFYYSMPLSVQRVDVEIQVVPLDSAPFGDTEFAITVAELPTTRHRFTASSPSSDVQVLVYRDVEVIGGQLRIEVDMTHDNFGVASVFVSAP